MPTLLFANNAAGELAQPLLSTDSSLVVVTGQGASFPAPAADQYFVVVVQSNSDYEIMHCTARTANTLTVTRAREGTTARAFPTGATVEMRITAGMFGIFAQAAHTHAISGVVGLQAALDGKAAAAHVHGIGDVTGLQSTLNGINTALDGKAATAHTHTISNVTGLQAALDGKAAAGHVHTASQITGLDGVYFRTFVQNTAYFGNNAGLGFYLTNVEMSASGSTLTFTRTYTYIQPTPESGP